MADLTDVMVSCCGCNMLSWRNACQGLLVISLLFLAIPIKVKPPEDENQKLFNVYIKKFNKSYDQSSDEYNKRLDAFKKSLSCIDAYNSKRMSREAAKYGLTKFSDMTEEEFSNKYLDQTKIQNKKNYRKKIFYGSDEADDLFTDSLVRTTRETTFADLPLKVDWRNDGIISEIKNQGLCGACWAYSTIHTIEAIYGKNHNFTSLSVQQMIDCAAYGNHGCKGGDICNLLSWISDNNVAIAKETDYPITNAEKPCHMKTGKNATGVHIKNYKCKSMVNKEKQILRWLAEVGPVAVAINALSWQNYLGGVIQYHCSGKLTSLNHAIQLVGYDLTAEIPFYIGKNSWGTAFGNRGYVYLAIGRNMCGLANEVSFINV